MSTSPVFPPHPAATRLLDAAELLTKDPAMRLEVDAEPGAPGPVPRHRLELSWGSGCHIDQFGAPWAALDTWVKTWPYTYPLTRPPAVWAWQLTVGYAAWYLRREPIFAEDLRGGTLDAIARCVPRSLTLDAMASGALNRDAVSVALGLVGRPRR